MNLQTSACVVLLYICCMKNVVGALCLNAVELYTGSPYGLHRPLLPTCASKIYLLESSRGAAICKRGLAAPFRRETNFPTRGISLCQCTLLTPRGTWPARAALVSLAAASSVSSRRLKSPVYMAPPKRLACR